MGADITVIRNDPDNNYCASIVFYQLATALKGVSWDMLTKYAETLEVDEELKEIINEALTKLDPHLRPLYDGIQTKTIDVADLPKSGLNEHGTLANGDQGLALQTRKPLMNPFDGFGMYGQTLYGCIVLFNRVFYAMQFGIWINNIIPIDDMHNLPIDMARVELSWNSYLRYMIENGMDTVPFISYIAFTSDGRSFEQNGHVMIGLSYSDGRYITFNSNDGEKITSDDAIALWVNDLTADSIYAYIIV